MPRPDLMDEDDIIERLEEMPLWKRDGKFISRELSAANFAGAVGMVNSIAILAETLDHHPDILIYGWNKIRITLSTHDRGGLTQLDFTLAKKIEELNF